jgi:membrane-bound metal-dependent hydrolase YbcI (DUF457 family)
MKGLTHFISGLAAATFFREAVEMSYRENSFILVMGGIFGILPDTIDFKFTQFVEHYDYKVDPDPEKPDAQQIADTLARAINEAHESGKPKSIMFMTIKKGADLWRQYRLFFDIENQKVRVTLGPLVNTSKKPFPGTEIKENNVAQANLNCALCKQVYDRETFVDIMSGPSFRFVPQKDGSVKIDFLSWHRRWSHSLTMGIFLGLIGWLLFGLWLGFAKALIYGLVITVGFWIHVLEDQLGYMGSNLFWPFTKEKTIGMKVMHSGDAFPNFITVWLALVFIFYNLNRFHVQPVFSTPFLPYFAYTFIVPIMVIYCLYRVLPVWDPVEIGNEHKVEAATSAPEVLPNTSSTSQLTQPMEEALQSLEQSIQILSQGIQVLQQGVQKLQHGTASKATSSPEAAYQSEIVKEIEDSFS